MIQLKLAAFLAGLFGCLSVGCMGKELSPKKNFDKDNHVSIIIVGDSTVCNYPKKIPRRGWGQMISEWTRDNVNIFNFAKSGRSTKTFIAEGLWKQSLEKMTKGGFALIQFGHNDSHAKSRPESTDAETDYKENLRKYITETRKAGATPILITPMHRRQFKKDKTLSDNLYPYADAMKDIAREYNVECVDLHALSAKVLLEMGEDGAIPLFVNAEDRTHFSAKGAKLMADLIMQDLIAKNNPIKKLVKPEKLAEE